MEKVDSSVQRRAFERIPASLEARFFYGNMFYSGIVTNISKNGMFIRTNVNISSESKFAIILEIEQTFLNVFVRIKRITQTKGYRDGIGVELLNDFGDYIEFVDSFQLLCK